MASTEKVAFVTGAGSGIGKATATLLAQQGIKVAAVSHTADEVQATVDEITRAGNEALAIVADVSQENQIQQGIQQVIDKWGRLDIVLANAGINGVWAPIEELSLQDWSHTITTNLTGTFLTIKYATPHLKKQGGAITVIASVNGTRVFSNTGATAYSASKAGQVAITKMLAVELAPQNVRVNVICPGATDTEISDNTQQQNVDKIKFPVEYPKGRIPPG
ncbi:3-ketoacyl-ACP reductase [Dictyobacter sp. S3.2.2.5]|uniref:3-ketoacyl-ACP reductase n=1 Tax=Dictyobacter halimunensis TaxID=3026934 RepID=A0ABQ6G703_9CHLR|nr:3-ketoacyl-ACP reductase [Dictyobacter sp. S3.2.2.5]